MKDTDQAKEQTSGAFLEIVMQLIEKAKLGSVTHIKLLLDMTGMTKHGQAGSTGGEEPSLGRILCDEVRNMRGLRNSQARNLPEKEEPQ